ncbi:hypothetical protein LCGC14_2495040 [marine sediment metagenome]|uniref:Uncharacterized protein n=1 Tax=marine sediment metagenome TaxID=412755 RepID=A0A0F9DXB8_9ZZZZ
MEEDKEFIRVKEAITNKLSVATSTTLLGPITTDQVEENGTSGTPAFGNIEPTGITTDTVAKWLKITVSGVVYYIPMWT